MSTAVLVSIETYLSTTFRPDCDYVDGVIEERNLGERDHSKVQGEIIGCLLGLRKALNFHVLPEQRVQVKATRFRIPDVCVLLKSDPADQIVKHPPLLCVEILSREDTMTRMQERISDYLDFGVRFVWVIDPRTRRAFVYTSEGMTEPKDGVLRTSAPAIAVPLAEIFV